MTASSLIKCPTCGGDSFLRGQLIIAKKLRKKYACGKNPAHTFYRYERRRDSGRFSGSRDLQNKE